MKKNILFCLVLMLFASNLNANNWFTSFEEAKKMALVSHKLILVDFWATWCGPCKLMDQESWSEEDVQLLMDNYVPLKIDIDRNRDIATQYGVKGIPFIFIMDGNGKVIYQQMSYKPKSDVIKLLKKYALNTDFLNQDLVNYYQKESFSSSFRLGKKYQDYALLLPDELKPDFLKLSDEYLDESSKFLKNSELKNKKAFKEKIELFDIQEKLILGKSSKALKMLNKLNESSINQMNVSFYNFLNYVTSRQLADETKENYWLEKLQEEDIQKAELFLKP